MLPIAVKDFKYRQYYLPLLLIISIISHFPFVLKGFGEIDATKIAVSVIDMLTAGPDAAFANLYFTDVIPLYVLYLKWSMKLLDYDYSLLPLVMNYTNAVFGTLIIIPAFLFIKQLFRSHEIAFYTVMALIFAPSYYQSTIMGFPHLISFFFLLVSLNFYLYGITHERKGAASFPMFLSCAFLTAAFLFKSDYVLSTGIFFGILLMEKVKDKGKIAAALLIVFTAGILFMVFRNLILGTTGGTTMSKEGLSKWYNFSLIIPSTIGYFIAQTKPVAYGAGLVTFCLGGISFIYYLIKKRLDVLTFFISWAAAPTIFWLVMIGNNARHNMASTLPLLTIIVIFFHEKFPRYASALAAMLVLGNFFVTAPSYSILTPSGNLLKSTYLLNDRMTMFQSRAKEIAAIKEDKIAVIGTFHNPHVVLEIIRSSPDYEAVKIGRENYRVRAGGKEYVFIYLVVIKPEDLGEGIDYLLTEYRLKDHVFVSATYDLEPLIRRGLKVKTLDIIEKSAL
ncbi:MAG: hypothetical protein HZA16_04055 [Nitrospirae bacterium]|nr:hypothetical protein [Nitrospirota bacterium]